MAKSRAKKSLSETLEALLAEKQTEDALSLLGDDPRAEDIEALLALVREREAGPVKGGSRPVVPRMVGDRPEPGLPGEYYVQRGREAYAAEKEAVDSSLDALVESRAAGVAAIDARKATAAGRVANIGKIRKGRAISKGLKLGGLGLGAYFLGDAVAEAVGNRRAVRAIESLPPATAEDYLRQMEAEELMRTRSARLMRNDPEAYAIMKNIGRNQGPAREPGIDAVWIGGQPVPEPEAEKRTEELLSALLRG